MPFETPHIIEPPPLVLNTDSEMATQRPMAARGSEHIRVSNSSALWHPAGQGLTTDKSWNSLVVNEDWTTLEGLLLESLPVAARTLEVRDAADTVTLWSMVVPAAVAATQFVPTLVRIGANGMPVPGPWALKLGGADYTCQLHFQRSSNSR